jgi:hypothetical protein
MTPFGFAAFPVKNSLEIERNSPFQGHSKSYAIQKFMNMKKSAEPACFDRHHLRLYSYTLSTAFGGLPWVKH